MPLPNDLWYTWERCTWDISSEWVFFVSERELINGEGERLQRACLDKVCDWDNLHHFLTGSSSTSSLTVLRIERIDVPDWTAVCRTLGSPDLRVQTVILCGVTNEGVAMLAAFLRSHTDEKLPLRNIGVNASILGARCAERIAEAFQGSDCRLEGFQIGFIKAPDDDIVDVGDKLALGFAKALREGKCNLRYLDLPFWTMSDEGAAVLFQALRSNGCKLSKLRLDGYVFPHGVKAMTSLTEALRDASCQLQRLDMCWGGDVDEAMSILVQGLESDDCKLVELRLLVIGLHSKATTTYFARALRSSRCRLEELWLIGALQSPQLLVDALQRNLRLTSLEVSHLPDALRVRCDALLQRNRRLRDGGLLERPQAKPLTAKLFICGHEQVGKTTVRKGLRRAKRGFGTIIPRDLLVEEPRTRGMEFEQLSFTTGSLVVCDLAGQKEYHAFHHYFVTGSDKDLFLIVCKDTESTSQHDFEFQLRYWLRFILSHRTPGMPRPKVIVLVNFFHSARSKESQSQVATGRTRQLVAHYQNDLDFGMPTNIFGINARKAGHLTPVLEKLEVLLKELLDSRPGIPSICRDLSSVISQPSNKLKLLLQSLVSREDLPYLPMGHIVSEYVERFCRDSSHYPSRMTFNAALVELHNSGQIIYFPSDNESKWEEEIVIADCGWFCHNLIGTLLEPKELRIRNRHDTPWIWQKEDVLNILRWHQPRACKQQLNQVLRYLQCLELVYPIHQENVNNISPESELLFPALLSETEGGKWERPLMEASVFLGRRLECEDKDRTLLRSGVFTRLQVRLHNTRFKNQSYKVV